MKTFIMSFFLIGASLSPVGDTNVYQEGDFQADGV